MLTTTQIKEMLKQWENVCRVVEVHHPNKMNAGHSVNLFEENGIRHFQDVLKMRQKQVSIDRFLMQVEKRRPSDLQSGTSAEKCPKKDTESRNQGEARTLWQ